MQSLSQIKKRCASSPDGLISNSDMLNGTQRTLLESYMVLAAQLKAKLLETQDEKNLLAQKHVRELSDARDAWERLQFRYERSRQEVRMVKKERDELKEGFEILLQKGTFF